MPKRLAGEGMNLYSRKFLRNVVREPILDKLIFDKKVF